MGRELAVFIVTGLVEMNPTVSSKRLLSAAEPGNQNLVLHSSMLLGESVPHPALNGMEKLVG
jgi:hypothetical protein